MTTIWTQPATTANLNAVGEEVQVTFSRTNPTSGTITWNLPSYLGSYNGIVILLKTTAIVPTDFPVDGTQYQASQDLNNPASYSGDAIVVGAFYNDVLTTSVNVINLDPNSVYFASGHAVTNTLQYFTRGSQSYPLKENASSYSGDIPQASSAPANPSVGQVYYNNQQGQSWMWTGSAWVQAGVGETLVGTTFPTNAVNGQYFYNETTKLLYSFYNGTFTVVNTAGQGLPMYEKLPGNDGSFNERAKLIQVIKRQLGWPSVCVELTEEHFQLSIDNALGELRRRSDSAYFMKWMAIKLNEQQQVYYMNDPATGTDKVVDIMKVWRTSGLGLVQQGAGGVYGQAFLNYFYAQNVVDLTSIYLLNSYAEQFSQIFAGEITFRWYEPTRQLHIARYLGASEWVIIEAMTERTEQELLADRYTSQWLQNWAVSEAHIILGQIRSKFGSLPGAGGSVSMNGGELIQMGQEAQTDLIRQINDFEVGNGGYNSGMYGGLMG